MRLALRILILLLVGWANIYCCCASAAPAPKADDSKPCCANKHTSKDNRVPSQNKCDECQFINLRQSSLLDITHPIVPPLDLCLIFQPLDVATLISAAHVVGGF